MTLEQTIVFVLVCLLIGLSKGGLGGPLPVALVTPLLALIIDDTKIAVSLVLPFLIFADWFALRVYWNDWNTNFIKLMLPMGIVGAIMGGLFLSTISDTFLKIIIGIVTIFAIIYKLLSDKLEAIKYKHENWHGYLAGWASAFSSTLANNGGPPFTIYMLLQRLEPVDFIATTTLYFTIINALKVPIFWSQGLFDFNLMLSVIWAFPIIPLGVWIGRRALDYIDQKTFERIMLGFLALSVLLLFATL